VTTPEYWRTKFRSRRMDTRPCRNVLPPRPFNTVYPAGHNGATGALPQDVGLVLSQSACEQLPGLFPFVPSKPSLDGGRAVGEWLMYTLLLHGDLSPDLTSVYRMGKAQSEPEPINRYAPPPFEKFKKKRRVPAEDHHRNNIGNRNSI